MLLLITGKIQEDGGALPPSTLPTRESAAAGDTPDHGPTTGHRRPRSATKSRLIGRACPILSISGNNVKKNIHFRWFMIDFGTGCRVPRTGPALRVSRLRT